MFSKIKKYVIGFFVLLGGALIAFFSGKDAGRSKERRKDVDKKLKIVKKALKSRKWINRSCDAILLFMKGEWVYYFFDALHDSKYFLSCTTHLAFIYKFQYA